MQSTAYGNYRNRKVLLLAGQYGRASTAFSKGFMVDVDPGLDVVGCGCLPAPWRTSTAPS